MTTEIQQPPGPATELAKPSAAVIEPDSQALAIYGRREDVRELAERIKLGLPGGRKLEAAEALSLAQFGIANGLNPMLGECWYIPPGESGKGGGPTTGIKGIRRKAHEQAERENSNHWTDFRQITDPKELDRLSIPANALAFECRLSDSKSIRAYAASLEALTKAGMPYADAVECIGKRPVTIGYGYFTPGEKSKMPPIQAAQKRAEADALKRRYDIALPFTVEAPESADAGFTVVEPGNTSTPSKEDQSGAVSAESENTLSPDERHALNRRKLGRRELDATPV